MSLENPSENEKSPKKPPKPEPYWTGPGYRGEYQCPCGVGHGRHVHGCCGKSCCRRDDFPLNNANFGATRIKEEKERRDRARRQDEVLRQVYPEGERSD